MPEMKTWTVGETTYEIVDAKAREAINEINTARENGEFKGEDGNPPMNTPRMSATPAQRKNLPRSWRRKHRKHYMYMLT